MKKFSEFQDDMLEQIDLGEIRVGKRKKKTPAMLRLARLAYRKVRNKKRIYNFNNSNRDDEYKKQHLAILKNKYTDKLCTFKEGKQLVYLINQIRSKSKK